MDQATKITLLALVASESADNSSAASAHRLAPSCALVRVTAADNGKEFACRADLPEKLGASFCFARPCNSWERGLNVHANGLVRQRLPQTTKFLEVDAAELRRVEDPIDDRPQGAWVPGTRGGVAGRSAGGRGRFKSCRQGVKTVGRLECRYPAAPAQFGGTMTSQAGPLLIKRYTSRRLYNTETSDYVTLQEIADVIRSGRDVRIVDRKTGDDLTRQYLVQIIAEHESRGEQVLPLDVLTEVVRTYNDAAKDVVPEFLDMSFQMLRKSKTSIMENMQAMSDPAFALKELNRQQKEFMSAMMDSWTGGPRNPHEPETKTAAGSKDGELEEIKKQLAELQSKVSNL